MHNLQKYFDDIVSEAVKVGWDRNRLKTKYIVIFVADNEDFKTGNALS